MHWVIEPGFFSSQPVHVAVTIGGVVAVVSAVVGVFTVVRGQSFGGHALTDVSTAGGSGASFVGMSPVVGFVGAGAVGAVAMEVIGVRRVRGRDLATGIVLGVAIGVAALLLYLDTSSSTSSGTTQYLLFGSIFTITTDTIPLVAVLGGACLAVMAALYRPLLLASVSDEIASARGIPMRLVGVVFMLALAVAVGLSALVIGSILSTAMLVGPAATALRLTKRPGRAVLVACLLGVAGTWLGILLAWDSAAWGSGHQGLPVSFFIVAVFFVAYLASGWVPRRSGFGGPVARRR